MRLLCLLILLCVCTFSLFAQAGAGTITGIVSDPTGSVVSNASVEAKNVETGNVYRATSTDTGNYTIPQLPAGRYELSVNVSGFKKYDRQNLTLAVTQVMRLDVGLEVGSNAETVTVTAEASLLKTESSDVTHNITIDNMTNLPILGIGGNNTGSSGIRNPYNSTVMIPGVRYVVNSAMVVNGANSNSESVRIEGQDATNHTLNAFSLQQEQPSADSIQEVAIQTSNYAAEFGTAGGGVFNITMKSGTNQYHGTAYDYFVNEFLFAGYPYSNDGSGHKLLPRQRRNDYGGSMGGPIYIPKIYDGRNKSFFFYNWEEYLENQQLSPSQTLPVDLYRNGDFSAISPNGTCSLCGQLGIPTTPLASKDALGRNIFANTVYDPSTRAVNSANGQGYANVFVNNKVPLAQFDPTTKKILNLIPKAANQSLLTANTSGSQLGKRTTAIPSLKVDQSISSKHKASFFWNNTGTDSQFSLPLGGADALPDLISAARGTFIHSKILRLNYDYTVTPSMLLHLGAGFQQINFNDDSPYTTFDPLKTCLPNQGTSSCTTLGLQGFENAKFFPTIASTLGTGSIGGMQQMGNALVHTYYLQQKPSFNANTTLIHQSHTMKFGGEVYFQGTITNPPSAVGLAFGAGATGLPFTPSAGLSGQTIGIPFASFLLGDLNVSGLTAAASQIAPTDYRVGKSQWAFFAQDTWKVTRKLTLDYGLRYDFGGYAREQYGRSANFSPNVPNPSAGNHPGAVIYEATCNCKFASNYPFAFGPRLGAAYQIDPKTVLRGGWGVVYSFTPDVAGNAAATLNYPQTGPSPFVNIQTPGVIPQAVWPVFDPGLFPAVGTTAQSPSAIDRNAGRPARQNQYSFGIQREISRNLVIEASYVANRGVWWAGQGAQSGTGPLGYLNQVSPDTYAKYGLFPYTNVADNTLIAQQINTTGVITRLGNLLPYAGFPTSSTVTQALRPFPQYSALNVSVSPTGNTWYDSLQVKATKRFSRGLQVNSNFTWSKAFNSARSDLFNPDSQHKALQSTDQPFLLNLNATYTTPGSRFLNRWRAANWVVKDWQIGTFVQYGSGLLLTPPTRVSTNNLVAGGSQIRVPGVPLYLKDLNCHCINPYTDQVLNPAAWQDPAQGVFGPSGFYSDFRGPRRPQENINFGRNFRLKERMNLQIRAEFVNMFNRTYYQNPTTTGNPINPPSRNGSGQITSGFGTINEAVSAGSLPTLAQPPRTGTLIARFTF